MLRELIIVVLFLFLNSAIIADDFKDQTTLKIKSKQELTASTMYLPNQWKFSSELLNQISEDQFQSLPAKDANTANTEYLTLREGDPEGAFVLKIDSAETINASIYFNGFAASNQIILVNELGTKIVYEHPAFSKKLGEYHRIQQDEIIFDLGLGRGHNYLILNYKFLPYQNSGMDIVNIGFAQWALIGDRTSLEFKADNIVSSLRIPLGVFLCLGIYSLLIYFSRGRSDQESLYLFLINIMFFLKESASQKVLLDFFGSNGLTQIFGSTVFATTIMASVGMVEVVRLVFDNHFFKWLSRITLANCLVSLSVSVLPLVVSFVPFTNINNLCALVNFILINMVLLPYSVVQAIRTKHYEVVLFAVGLTFLGCGIVIDLINVMYAMHWPWVSMWGGMIFSLLLAKNNSKKFAETYKESERLNQELTIKNREVADLNQNLEKTVEERTSEIQSLLKYIPQGIFSIGTDGVIESNYSAQLPTIIGHNNIAGMTVKEIIFDRSSLSADENDQAWQAILASIGEDCVNFEANFEKLPRFLSYQYSQNELYLKLTWNVELSSKGIIRHILVTALDATQEMEAKRELEKKNQDFEFIEQLLDAGAKKTAQFFNMAELILQENRKLVQLEVLTLETLKILFVNAHTLKGAARTLGFKKISNCLHEVEGDYGNFIKNNLQPTEDNQLLIKIQRVTSLLRQYEKINHEVLGRSQNYSTVQIDREFLETNFRLFQYFSSQKNIPEDIQSLLSTNTDQLVRIIFNDLENVLDEIFSQSEKIAKDLGKVTPVIEIDCPSIYINHSQESLLRKCFVHILRNCLDHGIENSDDRVQLGKEEQGHIFAKIMESGGQIAITVEDDGRGININHLRELGVSKGLIKQDADLKTIAELIFNEGISTARKTTEISGRGVGMSAVRKFLEENGGNISINLGEPKDDSENYFKFAICIEIPQSDIKEELNNSQKLVV